MSQIIYSSHDKVTSRQISLAHHWFKDRVRQILRIFGAGMLAYGIIIFMFSYGQIITQELNYNLSDGEIDQTITKVSQEVNAQDPSEVEIEAAEYNLTAYFSIVIPKIDAAANIIPNVDGTDSKDYLAALKKGVAHAKGTSFPGQAGRIFLFSHSTDSPTNFAQYNAVFYLLRKLEIGDRITVFFAARKYVYEVTAKIVADPDDTHLIESKSGEEELILMTCDPPGTTWRRLIVIAKPV